VFLEKGLKKPALSVKLRLKIRLSQIKKEKEK